MSSKIERLRHRLTQAAGSHGISGVAAEVHNMALIRVHEHLLDRFYQDGEPVAVATTTHLDELSIESHNGAQGVEYTPSPHAVLRWVFASLPGKTSDWTFIDIGAGRGRVLFAAAEQSFRRIIGVEFAAELHNAVRERLDRLPDPSLAERITTIHGDATQFSIPDGPCVFYLFNPFGKDIMRKFRDHVLASFEENPRPLLIAYSNPVHGEVFADSPHFRERDFTWVERIKFNLLSPHRYKIYEVKLDDTLANAA